MSLIPHAAAAVTIVLLLVGAPDRDSPEITAQHVRASDERKAFTPQQLSEIGYWKRHERHQAECRGQAYVAQCCDKWHDYQVTCLNAKDIR